MSTVKIAIMAKVPADCAQQFMQHLRDFDMAHSGVELILHGVASAERNGRPIHIPTGAIP